MSLTPHHDGCTSDTPVAVPILRLGNSAGTVKSDRSTQSSFVAVRRADMVRGALEVIPGQIYRGTPNLVVHLALAARVTSERLWVLRPYGVEGCEFALRSLFVAT